MWEKLKDKLNKLADKYKWLNSLRVLVLITDFVWSASKKVKAGIFTGWFGMSLLGFLKGIDWYWAIVISTITFAGGLYIYDHFFKRKNQDLIDILGIIKDNQGVTVDDLREKMINIGYNEKQFNTAHETVFQRKWIDYPSKGEDRKKRRVIKTPGLEFFRKHENKNQLTNEKNLNNHNIEENIKLAGNLISTNKKVYASNVYGDGNRYRASHVTNGQTTEEEDNFNYWLLPNDTKGWIEIDLNKEYVVDKIRILNTRNGCYNDRWTDEYTLEFKNSKGKVLETIEDRFVSACVWKEHIASFNGIRFIRLNVVSYGTKGGGINEIDVYGH